MDLIRINDTKLKVVLTAEDMHAYSLTCETIDYDNTETKRAFWDILDTAKHRTGFDAAREKVFVQVYPGRCGGCELYVTKLGRGKSTPECLVEREEKQRESAFFFRDLEALLRGCRLPDGDTVSDAYRTERGYYLFLQSDTADERLAEFGRQVQADAARLYIAEHGELICAQNAARVLGALA